MIKTTLELFFQPGSIIEIRALKCWDRVTHIPTTTYKHLYKNIKNTLFFFVIGWTMVASDRSSVATGVITRRIGQREPLRGAAFCARFSGHAHTTGGVINRQHLSRAVFMIYLIEAVGTNRVKIGFAISVPKRLPEIQCGCPFECKVIGTIEGDRKTERTLHLRYSHLRLRGEWFQKHDSIIAEFTKPRVPYYSPFLRVPAKPTLAKTPEPFLVVPAIAIEPSKIK